MNLYTTRTAVLHSFQIMSSNSHQDNSSSNGKEHATANNDSNEAGGSANARNKGNVNNPRSVDPPDCTSSRIQQPHQPYNDTDWSSDLDYKAQVNSRSVIRVVPPASTSTRDPPEGRSNNSSNIPELDFTRHKPVVVVLLR